MSEQRDAVADWFGGDHPYEPADELMNHLDRAGFKIVRVDETERARAEGYALGYIAADNGSPFETLAGYENDEAEQ